MGVGRREGEGALDFLQKYFACMLIVATVYMCHVAKSHLVTFYLSVCDI